MLTNLGHLVSSQPCFRPRWLRANQTTAPLTQEGYDLREQARWKLERAAEAAVAAKRWDAAGVAAFALAEVLGGDDSPATAGALMLHQVGLSTQQTVGNSNPKIPHP